MKIPASWAEKLGTWLLGRPTTPFCPDPGQPCYWVGDEPADAKSADFSLALLAGYWEVLPYTPEASSVWWQGKWYQSMLARLPYADPETHGYLMRQYNIHWRPPGSLIRHVTGRRVTPRKGACPLSLFISFAKGHP